MPASYVKPYVKRGKIDAADAEAICEAVAWPTIIKTVEQQAILSLHRTRDFLVRQRTALVNEIRGNMAEFGIVAPQGIARVGDLVVSLVDEGERLLELGRQMLLILAGELEAWGKRVEETEIAILALPRDSDSSRRLAEVPGIEPTTASAIVETVCDVTSFISARHFAAWIGLIPKQNSSGGKQRQGSISKQGDRYLRRLLVLSGTSLIRRARTKVGEGATWLSGLLERRSARLASVAQANKTARIVWALLARGERDHRLTSSAAATA